MKYTIHIGTQPIVLEHPNFDDLIDVDSMTQIDSSNIYGEAITAPAVANRVGMMKAEVESRLASSKLELKIFEEDFKAKLRLQASQNAGFYTIKVGKDEAKVKLTEKALESAFECDEDWIKLKKKCIKDERNVGILSSFQWSLQDKCRKLNNFVTNVTPEEFVDQLIEGKINGITIKKKS